MILNQSIAEATSRCIRASRVSALAVLVAVLCVATVPVAMADRDDSTSYKQSKDDAQSALIAAAIAALDKEAYQEAIDSLMESLATDGESADAFNLLGYSNRKLKNYDVAYDYYIKALVIEPEHLDANEYLGELYAETDQLDKAREQLDHVYKICGSKCEEYLELEAAILARE